MVADTTHPASKVADKPAETAPTSPDAAMSLSQQATKPGDQGALASVKSSATSQGLHEVHLTDGAAAPERPAPLDEATIKNTARELHEAITQTSCLGLRHNPAVDKILHHLGPLSEADCKALEKAYHDLCDKNGPEGKLRRDLKDNLEECDFRRCESILNRKDGRTNDAGALMTALSQAKKDSERGSAEVRAVLENLNSKQLAQLDADFKQQYGKSYLEAIKNSTDLTKSTRDALPILEKGVDKRSSQDLIDVARIAINNQDRRLFAEAVRGDSPQAVEARQHILADKDLKAKLAQTFPSDAALDAGYRTRAQMSFEQSVDPVALDYLKEGRISLATIASANTGKWLLDNKSNIELATKNASDSERQDFGKGLELALSGKKPANPEEKRELDFYNKIHGAFKAGGNDRETSIWEDQLIHGRETLISAMAKTHGDGWLGLGAGHDQNQLMSRVENLSKDDWQLLRGPDGGKFRQEIDASLKSYAPEDRTRVMQLLEQKAHTEPYEAAAKIHRNLNDTVQDSKGSVFLGMGTSYDAKNVINNILNMSPTDATSYKTDAKFRSSVDKLINENFDDTQKALARHLLKDIAATGKPPKVDAISTVLNDSVQGAPTSQILTDAEKALQDPSLRQAMQKPDNQLNDEQRQLKQTITSAVETAIAPPAGASEGYSYNAPNSDRYTKPLFETGHIPADLKSDLGYAKDQVLTSVAAAPAKERDAAMHNLSGDEQAIVKGIRQNPDTKPDLADRIRMMASGAGGNASDFKDELSKLSFNDRQKLKVEYTKKYGKDIDQDFLDKVDKGEKESYTNLLRPAETDGRQTYYDTYHRMLQSESGFSADGSKLTLERANDMYEQGLEEYHKVYKTLPPEKQQALDQFFNQSLEQYKGSKEKLAEIVVDATITAAALAAAPFTGGASLAAVVAMSAAAGAAFRVAAMKTIEGNDFDGSAKNITKQLIIGGSSAALNFIGAEVFTGAGQLAKGVSEQALAGVAMVGGRDVLAQGGREILEKALPKLIERGGKDVAEKELTALVAKAVPAASSAEREAVVRGLKDSIARTYEHEQARITEQIAQRTTKETLQHLGKEALGNSAIGAGANVTSEVLVAPFSEHGIDWDALKNGGLQGAVIGAVLPVALKGLIHAAGACGEAVTNLTRRADGLYVDPKNITEPITFHNTKTNQVRTFQPGQGEPLKLTNDWQPQSGGRPVKPGEHLRDASGKPAENPHAVGDATGTHHGADHTAGDRPSAKAVTQSNEFATRHQVDGQLEDGFVYASANRQFDHLGKPTTGSDPTFVVDKKELAPVIADAKARFASLPPEERALALSKYVHEKFNPPGMSQQDINKWYLSYLEAHPGQKITLGQLLKEGKGVCTQEAVLLKVLGDELGLKPSLVRGNGLDGGDDINHAWTTFNFGDGPRVFDPRQGIHNVPVEQVTTHKPGADIVAGQGGTDSGAGGGAGADGARNQYRYGDSDGWKIDSRNGDGTVNISRAGAESVKPGEALTDFQSLNADQLARDGGLKVGQQYKMRRADGSIDDSFKLDGVESDGSLRVSSDHAVHEQNVHPEKLSGKGPELAGSSEDLRQQLADKNQTFQQFVANAVEASDHAHEPAFQDAAKGRLLKAIQEESDLFGNDSTMKDIRDIANEYGLQRDPALQAALKDRMSREIQSASDLFKDGAKLKEIKNVAKEYGLQSDYAAQITKKLTTELQDNPALFSDANHVQILGDLLRDLKPHGKPLDQRLEAGLLQGLNRALDKVGSGETNLDEIQSIVRASGSTRAKNAVTFYEYNGRTYEGTLSGKTELTPQQVTKLGKLETALDGLTSRWTELRDVNKFLKPYGLATEKIDGEHYRVVDTTKSLLDKSTGNQMHPQVMKMTLTAARNANGEPTEKLGLAVDHRDGSTGDPVDRVYIKNILDSLIELYSTGARP